MLGKVSATQTLQASLPETCPFFLKAKMAVMSSFFQLGMYNFDQRVHAPCQQEALARKEGHKIK